MNWKQGNPGCECCESSSSEELICGCLGEALLATVTLNITSDTVRYKEFSNGSLSFVSDLFSLEGTYALTLPIADPCTDEDAPYANKSVIYEPPVGYESWGANIGTTACTPTVFQGTRDFYRFPISLSCVNSVLSVRVGWRTGYDTISPTPKLAIKWGNVGTSVNLRCSAGLVLPHTEPIPIVYAVSPSLCVSPSSFCTARLDITAIP